MHTVHAPCHSHSSHLNFNLPRSTNVKSDGAIELPVYNSILMFNSNIWPYSAPLRDIKLQIVMALVKYDGAIGLLMFFFQCLVVTYA